MLILCLERICRRSICAGPLQTGAEGTGQVESGAPYWHEAEKQESQRGIIYWARNERLTGVLLVFGCFKQSFKFVCAHSS